MNTQLSCSQAKEMDLVNFLYSIDFLPQKIRGSDHWYLSPLREEKEASFKVNKEKNVWYDHGIGKGGNLVDFVMEFYRCNISEALQKLSLFQPQSIIKSIAQTPPVHLQKNGLKNELVAGEMAIKIITAKQPIESLMLCSYLRRRGIDKNIADKFCHEVVFKMGDKEKEYIAIGFKNNLGGFELRNEYFKGSSHPKNVTYLDNKAINNITVFEGFFDFLSYQTIHQNQQQELTNFLVLNSLAFFERSLHLMEKYENIHLFLDNDKAGRNCLDLAQKRSRNFKDESKLYSKYKDLNEWNIKFGKSPKVQEVKHPKGRHL